MTRNAHRAPRKLSRRFLVTAGAITTGTVMATGAAATAMACGPEETPRESEQTEVRREAAVRHQDPCLTATRTTDGAASPTVSASSGQRWNHDRQAARLRRDRRCATPSPTETSATSETSTTTTSPPETTTSPPENTTTSSSPVVTSTSSPVVTSTAS